MKTQTTSLNPNATAPTQALREFTAALSRRLASIPAIESPDPKPALHPNARQSTPGANLPAENSLNSDSELANRANSNSALTPAPALLRLPAPLKHCPTRNGKIARMPLDVRNEINDMLRSGYSYQAVADKLEELGYPGINFPNISAWKHGGYLEWLHEQQQIERNLALPLALERCSRNIQLDRLQQNALMLATGQLTEIISRFDVDHALARLCEKPELLPAFIASLTAVGRCSAELTAGFELVQSREQTLRDQLNLKPDAPHSLRSPLVDADAHSEQTGEHSFPQEPSGLLNNSLACTVKSPTAPAQELNPAEINRTDLNLVKST